MRSVTPMLSSRSTGPDSAARSDGTRAVARTAATSRRDAVASSPNDDSSASAATHTLTPRQPIQVPAQAASGTPTSRVSDCPLITQPNARPCWPAATRWETSANTGPVNMPQQAPPSTAHPATARKDSAVATAPEAPASTSGPPIRNGRRPHRSDSAPATMAANPQAIEVTATRLATSGTLLDRSRAMSIRNGARVMPLPAAVNMASEAAISRAQGMRSWLVVGERKGLGLHGSGGDRGAAGDNR